MLSTVFLFLAGNSAFALTMQLITPYKDTGKLTAEQEHFNDKLTSTLEVVEGACRRLKTRWPRLTVIHCKNKKRAQSIIVTCLILHNFLLKHDSDLPSSSTDYEFDSGLEFDSADHKRVYITNYLKDT